MKLSKVTFSRLPRNLSRGDVVQDHKLVMSLFPDALGDSPRRQLNVLWRRDIDSMRRVVFLVQSSITPSIAHLKSARLVDALDIQTKDIAALYREFISGESFSYKVRVNPVVSRARRRVPVTGEEAIADWWVTRLQSYGAQVSDDALIVIPEGVSKGGDSQKNLTINGATIIGRAAAQDADLLLQHVSEGVGRARSYGYGLILLGR